MKLKPPKYYALSKNGVVNVKTMAQSIELCINRYRFRGISNLFYTCLGQKRRKLSELGYTLVAVRVVIEKNLDGQTIEQLDLFSKDENG